MGSIAVAALAFGLAVAGCDASPAGGETAVGREESDGGRPKELEEWLFPETGEIVSFTCETKLGDFRDPCLEGGCCGFPRGGAGECWETARCGYGTVQGEGDDRATGAVCSCSWCDRYRVSCTADYETGDVECICSVAE